MASRGLMRELAWVLAVVTLVTVVVAWVQDLWPPWASYAYLGVLVAFIGIPTWVVERWRKVTVVEAGMVFGCWWRSLGWALGAAFMVLVPYALGHHFWRVEVDGHRAEWSWSHYSRWPEAAGVQGAAEGLGAGEVRVMAEGEWLWLRWRGPFAEQGQLLVRSSGGVRAARVQGARLVDHGGEVHLSSLGMAGGGTLEVRGDAVEVDGVGGVRLWDGEGLVEGLRWRRSAWWLVQMLLTQLLLVALPEEYFYRGYVQPTLARRWDGGIGVGRWRLSWAVLLTSAIFALGHVVVDARLERLAVFFPSLAFGWLRERSGGLWAPLVFHGLCNVWVELLGVHYFVS